MKTSREGRAVLGEADDISESFLASLNEGQLESDWLIQNQAAEALWQDLNSPTVKSGKDFVRWQSWYSKEDLQRVFRIAYQNLGVEGRKERRAFSEDELEAALLYHDQTQFAESSWNVAAFERWLKKYEGEGKQNAIPGLNKVLMNKAALFTLLRNYSALDICSRNQAQSMPCPELKIRFPRGAAFLKTAWRRAQIEGDFTLPYFQTNDLMSQLSSDEWQKTSEGIPLTVSAERMETPTAQVFHLVAVHLTLKLDKKWFWTSHWLDDKTQTAVYKSCSTLAFTPLAKTDRGEFENEIHKAEALSGQSWCSNPYLETGLQNHRTNCIGCHQHAGTPWTEDDFNDRLQNDIQLLLGDAKIASRTDQVWSLLNGPEPFVSYISQEIDYFDVYDL